MEKRALNQLDRCCPVSGGKIARGSLRQNGCSHHAVYRRTMQRYARKGCRRLSNRGNADPQWHCGKQCCGPLQGACNTRLEPGLISGAQEQVGLLELKAGPGMRCWQQWCIDGRAIPSFAICLEVFQWRQWWKYSCCFSSLKHKYFSAE